MNIILLAAGDIRNKFVYIKNSCSCPALIPLNTKPIAAYTLEALLDVKGDIYLVVDKDKLDEVKEELYIPILRTKTKILGIDKNHGVNESIEQALSMIPYADETMIHLITSLPISFPSKNQVYLSENLSKNEEWSVIRLNGENMIFASKFDKNIVEGHAFTGIFRVETYKLIEALNNVEKSDLLDVVKYISNFTELDFVKTHWMDCGHELNYFDTKKKFINSRSFNKIQVTSDNLLIKSSSDTEKLLDEKNYIFSLPSKLAKHFPKVIEDAENTDHFVMEYFNVPNVAELLLYWDLPEQEWGVFFHNCEIIINDFKKYLRNKPFGFNDFQSFYLDKTTNRLNEFMSQQPTFAKLSECYIINGIKCNSLNYLVVYIKERIKLMYNDLTSCVMHGDFCFNNILYDISTKSIKLIDARGCFGKYKGIYGDLKYDIAKLLHSSVYGYDYLVNDLFVIEEDEGEYSYNINWRKNRSVLRKESVQMVKRMGLELEEIEFIVSLLFLSMTPLHSDSVVRQKAMFLHGLYLLNENYSNYEKNLLRS